MLMPHNVQVIFPIVALELCLGTDVDMKRLPTATIGMECCTEVLFLLQLEIPGQ